MSDVHQTLRNLLAEGEHEKVLSALKIIFEQENESGYASETLLLTSRLNQIKTEERQGRVSPEEMRRERARIAAGLPDLIAKVPANATLPHNIKTLPTAGAQGSAEGRHQPLNNSVSGNYIPLFAGIGLVLIVVALIYLIPCPSNMQAFVVRALTATGIASLSYYLSGALELNLPQGVKASGVLGILALVYMLNPVDGLMGQDCITEVPVTVFVHGKGGQQDMVLRQQGHILMDYRGERKRKDISENGEAFFNNLKVGEKVRIGVDFSEPYKPIRPDSLYIIDNSGKIYLEVALQNLEKVFGRVIFKNKPLDGVLVSIGPSLRDTTDALGYYEVKIPSSQQRKEQEVTFYKPGFKMLSKNAFPQTNEPLNIPMEKE